MFLINLGLSHDCVGGEEEIGQTSNGGNTDEPNVHTLTEANEIKEKGGWLIIYVQLLLFSIVMS